MKILKKTIKILNRLLLIILICFFIFLINGAFEHFVVQGRIEDFKARAVGEPVKDDKIINTYYYRVPAREGEDTSRNIFDFDTRIIGAKADIITSNRNPLRDYQILRELVAPFAKYLYLGHTSINSTEDGSYLIETIGNSVWENNKVQENRNDWITSEEAYGKDYSSPVIIGLRVKNTTSKQRDKMVEYARSKIDYPYNFSFLFNRANAFYCTDIVSRAIEAGGVNVNYDFLATTGTDILTSENVYIFFIREVVIENGVERYNIYYLD
ncbi:MAG TPA: hypothetical protein GX692_02005 [Acholeplasmataceae bacterium]|jgi:hypothetical protein|nr:hypothetical protein [Acholeplasmataceae bacterium]